MSFTLSHQHRKHQTTLQRVSDMIIVVDGTEFVLVLISTTATTIFAVIQTYIKLKQLFLNAVKSVIQQEVDTLREEIKMINEKHEKLEQEIEEIKNSIKNRD